MGPATEGAQTVDRAGTEVGRAHARGATRRGRPGVCQPAGMGPATEGAQTVDRAGTEVGRARARGATRRGRPGVCQPAGMGPATGGLSGISTEGRARLRTNDDRVRCPDSSPCRPTAAWCCCISRCCSSVMTSPISGYAGGISSLSACRPPLTQTSRGTAGDSVFRSQTAECHSDGCGPAPRGPWAPPAPTQPAGRF